MKGFEESGGHEILRMGGGPMQIFTSLRSHPLIWPTMGPSLWFAPKANPTHIPKSKLKQVKGVENVQIIVIIFR